MSVLRDISDNQKGALEDDIQNSLNVPLYLGLAGTFVGIITGLIGVDFNQIFGTTSNLDGLQHLLYGVVAAMFASLLGMASSLNSLKGVLGHFVDKFGRNLDAYADSTELLNDNLEKQHLVLSEINKLSLTQTANKIAETFIQLKESADSLNVFRTYQKQLNSTIANVSGMVNQIQTIIGNFNDFATGLSVVISNQNKTTELQREFQEAITIHFPTGGDARDVWRKEFDMLISEGKTISENLSTQLTVSTEYIKNFIANNKDFFDTFDKFKEVLDTMVQYTQVQAECYKDLRREILNLRKDYKDAQMESIDLHKSMLKAIDSMTKALDEIRK